MLGFHAEDFQPETAGLQIRVHMFYWNGSKFLYSYTDLFEATVKAKVTKIEIAPTSMLSVFSTFSTQSFLTVVTDTKFGEQKTFKAQSAYVFST